MYICKFTSNTLYNKLRLHIFVIKQNKESLGYIEKEEISLIFHVRKFIIRSILIIILQK